MASIVGLRWTNSQELLADVDLDVLYVRQVQAIGGHRKYPYVLLLHTGKIMIGIDLGYSPSLFRDFGPGIRAGGAGRDEGQRDPKIVKETIE